MVDSAILYNRKVKPSMEDLVEAAEHSIRFRIEFYRKKLADARHAQEKISAQEMMNEALAQLGTFKGAVSGKDIPDGFELRPVFFEKVDAYQNSLVWQDFTENVRWRFRKFLAYNRVEDLKKFGLCDHGIEMMKEGLHPEDEHGERYQFSIDHIVERAGGGRLSFNKAADPFTSVHSEETYLVNHYKNLMLLPDGIHNLKNTLNDAQTTASMTDGEGKWVLMLLPQKNGFFAPKQSKPAYSPAPRQVKEKVDPVTRLTQQAKEVEANLRGFIDDGVSQENADSYLANTLVPAVKKLCSGLRTQFTTALNKNDRKKSKACMEKMHKLMNTQMSHELLTMVELVGMKEEAEKLTSLVQEVAESLSQLCSKKKDSKPAAGKTAAARAG